MYYVFKTLSRPYMHQKCPSVYFTLYMFMIYSVPSIKYTTYQYASYSTPLILLSAAIYIYMSVYFPSVHSFTLALI